MTYNEKMRELYDYHGSQDILEANIEFLQQMRKEAIEEVKELRKERNTLNVECNRHFVNGQISYLIKQWNISEEELK